MMPRPAIADYDPVTGYAVIHHGEHLSAWMSEDDLYAQAFAWFDLARELRGRNLAVEAVQLANDLIPANDTTDPEVVVWPWSAR